MEKASRKRMKKRKDQKERECQDKQMKKKTDRQTLKGSEDTKTDGKQSSFTPFPPGAFEANEWSLNTSVRQQRPAQTSCLGDSDRHSIAGNVVLTIPVQEQLSQLFNLLICEQLKTRTWHDTRLHLHMRHNLRKTHTYTHTIHAPMSVLASMVSI